ncbi:Transposase and inactivated derivatives, IS30 family [Proteus mirabilis]|uniref:Transposase and inactivated derivatives, IS30 family n=1 Tax=Proteus mirabilis TaxID=584 RepID=A0A379GIW2_PROMI|nr:hypothetical protein SAMN04487853_1025 [Proteus mirabilis]SUC40880.1 Transposase and inactivated derivatives, IS30 family [Proteus mirabilis]
MHRGWSPEQIAGWLKRNYPDAQGMNVSHETIYKTLFIQTRGTLKKSYSNILEAEERYENLEPHHLKEKD